MNKERRKQIDKIRNEIEKIKSNLEDVKIDEEITFSSMPENLQYSMRGETSQDAINSMDCAIENLQSAIDNLDEII